MSEEKLIFIGGCMRSGTTILHRVLCAAEESHPYITESWYLLDQLRIYRWCLQRYDIRYKDYFGPRENFDRFTRNILQNYFDLTRSRYQPAKALILKNPEVTSQFPLLGNWFAEARFVVNIRDPRDTIASIVEVGQRHLARGVTSPQSRLGRDMKSLSSFYKSYYVNIFTPAAVPIRDRILFVRYEDIMTNPVNVVRQIGEFCGLTFDLELISHFGTQQEKSPNMDKDTRDKDPISAGFWSELYTKDLSDSRIGRFTDVLTAEEISQIEEHCADFNRVCPYW